MCFNTATLYSIINYISCSNKPKAIYSRWKSGHTNPVAVKRRRRSGSKRMEAVKEKRKIMGMANFKERSERRRGAEESMLN